MMNDLWIRIGKDVDKERCDKEMSFSTVSIARNLAENTEKNACIL